MEEHIKMLGKIKNKNDFLKFMELYISTIKELSIIDYLESIRAWAEDMEGYYKNIDKEIPQDVNWDFIATLFYVGSIYE